MSIEHMKAIVGRWYQTMDQALLAHGVTPETINVEEVRHVKYLDKGEERLIGAYYPDDDVTYVHQELFYRGIVIARLSSLNNSYNVQMFVPLEEGAN